MANLKISDLMELISIASDDELVIIDKSDTDMNSTGTNKRIKASNLLMGAFDGGDAFSIYGGAVVVDGGGV